jgi:hypothetical protein
MAESKLQSWAHKKLKRSGWEVVKISLCSRPGWPDTEAIRNGRTVRIEFKDEGKKLEPLQRYIHKQIKDAGGEVYTASTKEEFLSLNLT